MDEKEGIFCFDNDGVIVIAVVLDVVVVIDVAVAVVFVLDATPTGFYLLIVNVVAVLEKVTPLRLSLLILAVDLAVLILLLCLLDILAVIPSRLYVSILLLLLLLMFSCCYSSSCQSLSFSNIVTFTEVACLQLITVTKYSSF